MRKINSPINVSFNFGRKLVPFRVSKTFITGVLSCTAISDNPYICYRCLKGEEWTGTE